MKCKSVLVAGYGYLGESLAGNLRESGHPVVGLTKSESTGSDPSNNPVYACDISDPAALASLTPRFPVPEAVVHCASSNRGGPDAYRSVFVDGAHNLVTAYPGSHLFITSSTGVYGQTDGSVVTEESPAEPDRETGRLLRRAEEIVLDGGGTVLRLAGIYGPGRSVHLKRFLAETATIESGEISRLLNQIHRDDAVSAIVHLLGVEPETIAGEIFNVTDLHPLTQRACYEKLAAHFDRPVPPEAPPDLNRKRAWTHKSVSSEKLQDIGWTPRYPDFIAAVENDPDLVPSIRQQLEITRP